MQKVLLMCFLIFSLSLFAGTINLGNSRTDVNVLNSNDFWMNIDFRISQLNSFEVSTKQGVFSQISIPEGTYSTRIGEPKLPIIRKLIAVPFGAEVRVNTTGFSETEYLLSDFGINYPLLPAQLPVPKSADPSKIQFTKNTATYESNNFNTSPLISVEEVGSMRGVRIFALILEPVKYNPVSGTIRVFNNVNVQVDFIGADLAATNYMREKAYSHYFNALYSTSLLNYETVVSRDELTRYPVKYVIISDRMFEAQMQTFIEWKIEKGFEVIEAYTDEPNVGSTTTSIKAFLQDLYDAATPDDPAPSFVLFVGDVAQIPAWNGSEGSHITDLNYVKLDGTNIVPDMYYGRFSANNTTELQPQIDKTLMYEKYEMPDPAYLEEVVMIAGMDSFHGSTWGNGQINYGTENYFNAAHGISSYTYLYPNSGSNSANIVQNVSDGVGYINYTAHGSSTSWANPSFTIANINSLQNYGEYCLAVGNCCLTNKFEEYTCFGEAWLRAADKGAVGYIGGTNSTYWDEDYWWGVGAGAVVSNPTYATTGLGVYDGLFHDHGETFADWTTTTGAMIWRGNMAVTEGGGSINYYWEIYSIMGDPSLEAFLGVPQVNIATYPDVLFLGLTSMQVTADPYSYVSLSMDGDIYAVALVGESGIANLEFEPFSTPGMASIVISKQNRIPIIDEIEVIPSGGPYVLVESYTVTDDNNNIPEYNETINLDMSFENVGTDDAIGVSATLNTDDEYVNITNGSVLIGDITAGSIVSITDAFEMEVTDNIPDQYMITFTVEMVGTATWTSTIFITFNAPLFDCGTMIVEDSGGNGMLDPGETATLYIPLSNIGNALSMDIVSMLSTANPDEITIVSDIFNLDPLAGGEEAIAEFSVIVSSEVLPGTVVSFFFVATSGEYDLAETIYAAIGLVFEDFETGDFSAFAWQFGAYGWEISEVNPYEGNYSAKSSIISHNQTASLTLTMDVPVDGEISFFRRVSSEANYDYLKFYINGSLQDDWCGEVPWGEVAFNVPAGNNVIFKWDYSKDGSVSNGSDCSWIDYIVFPGVGGGMGSPVISLDVNELEFGTVLVGESAIQQFTISNDGDATLIGVIMTPDCFTINQSNQATFTVLVGEEQTIEVEFAPAEAIEYNDCITIISNDATQPTIELPVHGLGDGTGTDPNLIPALTQLYGNYPNPFNPTTTISYGLSQDSEVTLFIFNIKGQKVKTLMQGTQKAGYHQIFWNGKDENNKNVSSGVYFYEIDTEATDYTSVKKMLLLK
ncbi:MAG: C25 family cysteine peptidase [Candidatus Cloacimonadales bacterium]|nr:C25 family cysteine peptidase [Candidatus Cloacimonadales bacterium]